MVVPHDCGSTHRLQVSSSHVWVLASLAGALVLATACFAFASAFLFQRHQAAQARLLELKRDNRSLVEQAQTGAVLAAGSLTAAEREAIEKQLRDGYEASNRAIVAELNKLFETEAQIREIHKLAPRVSGPGDYVTAEPEPSDGRGGPPGRLGTWGDLDRRAELRPSHVIYGLSRPSADLILEEVRLRTASLADLRDALLAEQDRIDRMPAGWPVVSGRRRLSSGFGYRRDPFTPSVRHHDGVDISAPYGTAVVATGRGLVIFSDYDGYLGHTVRVDHGDGYVTVYAHLSRRLVEVGAEVSRGDGIGHLGSSGRSTGPHLHYEVHVNGKPTDPERFLPTREGP